MPARYETIAQWVNERGWTAGAEIGVFSGRTHFFLLDNCPSLNLLIGVDVWDLPGFAEGPTKSGEKCRCQFCNETREDRRARTVAQMREHCMLRHGPYGGQSQIFVEPSSQASRRVKDGSLDFIFVDGDHSTEGVEADLRAWRSKVKPGGRIIGHDWNMRSVRDGVRRVFGDIAVIQDDDHVWSVDV